MSELALKCIDVEVAVVGDQDLVVGDLGAEHGVDLLMIDVLDKDILMAYLLLIVFQVVILEFLGRIGQLIAFRKELR